MGTLEFGIFDSFGPFEMAEFPMVADVYEAHIREAQEAEQLGYRYYFTTSLSSTRIPPSAL